MKLKSKTIAKAILLFMIAHGYAFSPKTRFNGRYPETFQQTAPEYHEGFPSFSERSSERRSSTLFVASRLSPGSDDKGGQKRYTGPLFIGSIVDEPISMPSEQSASQLKDEKMTSARADGELLFSEEEGNTLSIPMMDNLLSGYTAPRVLLAAISCFYATNFPLGTMMADALPAPAVTSARMVLASLALSPFLFKIEPSLRIPAILCGCFTAMGYITQSLALVDTSPATVSFLGATTVVICPFLEWAIDKKPMALHEAPQRWLAATLCLLGVGTLELWDPSSAGVSFASSFGMGDAFALLQAVGFGTQIYFCEKMIRDKPSQALPVTATLIATSALLACVWCFLDGWMAQPGFEAYTLPNLFFEPSLRNVAAAVAWTGIVSTSLSFFVETSALGRVPSSEASVILATEPMWAALFASVFLGENFGLNDGVGGALIILACLANVLKPSDFDIFRKDK